jgi:CRP-like cAMP-binding protein
VEEPQTKRARDPVPGDGVVPATTPVNGILARLPPRELAAFTLAARPFRAPKGRLLAAPGTTSSAIFPISGLISLGLTDDRGDTMIVDVVGREGMAGLWLHLDDVPSPYLVTALVPLAGWMIDAAALRRVAAPGTALATLLARYAQLRLTLRAHLMHCNRTHELAPRLARFLLGCAASSASTELEVSHEELASGVGAHRPAVTDALHRLAALGAVRSGRRLVQVTSDAALAAAACGCAQTVAELQQRFERPR